MSDSFARNTIGNLWPRSNSRILEYKDAEVATSGISASGVDTAIIAAPGANKAILIWGVIHWADGTSKVKLHETDSSSRQISPTMGLNNATSVFRYPLPLKVTTNTAVIAYADQVSGGGVGTNVMILYTVEDV